MNKSVLCIGATLVDELYFCKNNIIEASSNPADKTTSIGGVMSNIAQHLALLNIKPSIITALGNDAEGKFVQESFLKSGIEHSQSIIVQEATGKYVSILKPDGNLYVAVCQDNCSAFITVDFLESKCDFIRKFDLLIIDTNLAPETIQWIIHFAKNNQKQLIIEPVSVSKAAKLAALDLNGVFMITPNEDELAALANDTLQEEQLAALFDKGVETIWLRKGAQGSVVFKEKQAIDLDVPIIQIIDSTGAGDAALAGWVFGYVNDEDEKTCLQLGHTLALEILKRKGAVDQSLTVEKLYKIKKTYYND